MVAFADSHAFWTVALGIGAVVIAVVVVLMALLLSFLRDIASSVNTLIDVGGEIGANTAVIAQLGDTGPVLEMIRDEALVHDGYLGAQLR